MTTFLQPLPAFYRRLHPEAHFRINPVTLCLSQITIKQETASPGSGHNLERTEIVLGEETRRVLLIIMFSREELIERKTFF